MLVQCHKMACENSCEVYRGIGQSSFNERTEQAHVLRGQ